MNEQTTLIIGAGLAGLTAAWRVAAAGQKVRLITKGWGTTHWHAGCVDVLGYYPLDVQTAVSSPIQTIEQLTADFPHHPYALTGVETLAEALQTLQTLCAGVGYPLHGSLAHNWLLPSAVGTFRPTCLAPETMIAGDLQQKSPMLLVGFQQFADFYAQLAADNLTHQGIPARGVMLQLPTLQQRRVLTAVILAQLMEQPAFRAELVAAVKPHLGNSERVGFPAVLGLSQVMEVKGDLEKQLQRPIFEIPVLPPSVPGMRLHTILRQAIEQQGGRVYEGMRAIGAEKENGRITTVYSEAAARQLPHRFDQVVLATGGILGGGFYTNFAGQVQETIFDLPVMAPNGRLSWFNQQFMAPNGHPIYRAGLTVNARFQPMDGSSPCYDNLYAAGTTLAHCEVIRERSLEGVALATGYAVGQQLATYQKS